MIKIIKEFICKIFGFFCEREVIKPKPLPEKVKPVVPPKVVEPISKLKEKNKEIPDSIKEEMEKTTKVIIDKNGNKFNAIFENLEENKEIPDSIKEKIEKRINEKKEKIANKHDKEITEEIERIKENKINSVLEYVEKEEEKNKEAVRVDIDKIITETLKTRHVPDKDIKEIIESVKDIEKLQKVKVEDKVNEILQTENKVLVNKKVLELIHEIKQSKKIEEPDSAVFIMPKNREILKTEVKRELKKAIVNEDGISMYRIVLCWSMTENVFKGLSKTRYHFAVDQNGNILKGTFDVSDNLDIEYKEKPKGTYAVPTRGLNDNTISIAMLGMKGYKVHEDEIVIGNYPINRKQYDTFCILAYHLATIYDINVDLESMLTRSEIEPVLKKKQKSNTYDFRFLPFDNKWNHVDKDPTILGEKLRDDIWRINHVE